MTVLLHRGMVQAALVAAVAGAVWILIQPRTYREPHPAIRTGIKAVPPTGEAKELPITRDTWLSAYRGETDGSNGGAARLKLKSIQEFSLLDFDAASLKGRVVTAATLHLKLASEEILHRVTVSTVAGPWHEGTASGYAVQDGASTFNRRRHPDEFWAGPGSNLSAVVLGHGGTFWRMADAHPPDEQGWQRIAVDPLVVRACVAGISNGLFVFDDTGSEWTRDGEKFTSRLFPNRFVYSREQGRASAPRLTVYLGPADDAPPPAVEFLPAGRGSLLGSGEALVAWRTPADEGQAGTVGFLVQIDGKPAPRHLIPAAGPPGSTAAMHLRELDLPAGGQVNLSVQAVDGAGNVGNAAETVVRLASRPAVDWPGSNPPPLAQAAPGSPPPPLPRVGSGAQAARVAVIDPLDKILTSGETIPTHPAGYLAANHLWDAARRTVKLHAARNELVFVQLAVLGRLTNAEFSLAFPDLGLGSVRWHRARTVSSKQGAIPDPLIPIEGPVTLPGPDPNATAGKETPAEGPASSVLAEFLVPKDASPGIHTGSLTIASGNGRLTLRIELEVWDFALPDELSFLPEMNSYGLPDNERDYYRLAHRYRTVLNRLPYNQRGEVMKGGAPEADLQKRIPGSPLPAWNWDAWDRRFGPLFDGSAFADLPRAGVPLELFYLPLHENWPLVFDDHFSGSYWADESLPPRYWDGFAEASRRFAEHIARRGWNRTLFHVYLNNKVDFKRNGWSRGSSIWLLDEPANFHDYWALRVFGEAFLRGRSAAESASGAAGVPLLYRCDISRPQWQRDVLDQVLDYNVIAGGAFQEDRRLVLDRQHRLGQLVIVYGTTNAPEESNVQPCAWAIDVWRQGGHGVLPWQTIGRADSWQTADRLALFYPGPSIGRKEPLPSMRLLSYTRGQQDVEYLVQAARRLGITQEECGRAIEAVLPLRGEKRGTGAGGEDAGVIDYGRLAPRQLWEFRIRTGAWLSAQASLPLAGDAPGRAVPAPITRYRPPPRDPPRNTPGYVSAGDVPAR